MRVFSDDLEKSAPQINFTPELYVAIINKCVDQMTYVRVVCEKKKADIKIVRMELEILESGAAQFTLVPLDDDRLPVLVREECPMLIVAPSREDIEETKKTKEIELFSFPEAPEKDPPPEEDPPPSEN